MAVFNGAAFLRSAIDSVLTQTLRDFEFIIVDDGSSDGSGDIIGSYDDPRIRLILNQENQGLARSLNRGLEAACGEFVARIDADDICESKRLERQVRFLEAHPEVAVVGSQITFIDETGAERGVAGRFAANDEAIAEDMLDGPGVAHPAVLFRRSAVLSLGGYRDVGLAQDYDLWLRLAVHHKFANIDEPLLRYRIHDRNLTVLAEREGMLRKAAMARFVEHAPALYGISETEAQRLVDRQHRCAIPVLLRIARQLHERSGRPVMEILTSRYFLSAARKFLAPADLSTRAVIYVLKRRPWKRRIPPLPSSKLLPIRSRGDVEM